MEPDRTDRELVADVATGSTAALEELYRRHAPWLTARLSRRCADPGTVDAAYTPQGDTVVTLHVHGLRPHREYGIHANALPCGTDPADPGPRFQANPDPKQPSHDARYANIHNEIWLDVTTDAQGDGEAVRRVAWQFPPAYRAHSVVVHARQTDWRPALAGKAGARLACIDVPF